jgi:erythromycin esterase
MFFANMVRAVDAERAITVATRDQDFMVGVFNGGVSYATANKDRLSEFYGGLERFFEEHRAALQERFGPDAPVVAQRAAWSMLRYMEQLRASTQQIADRYEGSGAIRDFGMANNLTFLANELYPGRKILVWAHNGHIRHDNAGEHERALPTMGQWIRERFRDQLYTVGLYMNQGTAALNNRAVYSITPGEENSMEWIMSSIGAPVLFMDFLAQARVAGNSWMFERTPQREWGMNPPFPMVPRNQYDGVLFVEAVKSPSYIQ